MTRWRTTVRLVATLAVLAITFAGCESGAGTGTLAGAGVGALVGQLAGGDTTSTLVGAGIGAGVGYLIGNEADKAEAQKRTAPTATDMAPFAGTAWQLLSVNPAQPRPVRSLVARFNADGTVLTSRSYEDGRFETASETYRVVGSTLIVNRPGYIINARFRIEGDKLYLSAADRSAVLVRV